MAAPDAAPTWSAGRLVDFAFVDVFAIGPLTGNALTVVPDADALDVGTMKSIAREFQPIRDDVPYPPTLLTVPEIAAALFGSVNTLKVRMRHIYRTLGASSRPKAVARE